jgi:hypothetical protein
MRLTASRFITYSPGVSIAGTVSVGPGAGGGGRVGIVDFLLEFQSSVLYSGHMLRRLLLLFLFPYLLAGLLAGIYFLCWAVAWAFFVLAIPICEITHLNYNFVMLAEGVALVIWLLYLCTKEALKKS